MEHDEPRTPTKIVRRGAVGRPSKYGARSAPGAACTGRRACRPLAATDLEALLLELDDQLAG